MSALVGAQNFSCIRNISDLMKLCNRLELKTCYPCVHIHVDYTTVQLLDVLLSYLWYEGNCNCKFIIFPTDTDFDTEAVQTALSQTLLTMSITIDPLVTFRMPDLHLLHLAGKLSGLRMFWSNPGK